MLISKTFRRHRAPGSSRFGDDAGEFPLRRYLRLREDLGAGTAQASLLAILAVLMAVLGRACAGLFMAHGAGWSPWLRVGVGTLVAIFALSVLWRLCYKLVEMRQIRREMQVLRSAFRQAGETSRQPADAAAAVGDIRQDRR